MSKTKTITITVKKGRHAEQPYTYTIDQGRGPLMTPRERFTTRRNAKRSALRKLGAWHGTVRKRQVSPVNGKMHTLMMIDI